MDAAAIKQALEQIGEMTPQVPAMVTDVGDQAQKFADATAEAHATLVRSQGRIRDMASTLEEKIGEFAGKVEADRARAEAALADLVAGLDTWSAIDDARGTHVSAISGVMDQAEALGEAIRSQTAEVEAARDDVQAGLEEVADAIAEGREALDNALSAAAAEIEAIQSGIADAKSSLAESIDQVGEAIGQRQQEMTEKLQSMLEEADGIREQFSADLDDVIQSVFTDGADKLVDEIRQKVETELKELVDRAVGEIADAIEGLENRITEAKENSSGARALLEPVFDQVEAQIRPLENIIESIKDAADKVGISF